MPTPFGPQLVGETEKTLGAILRSTLGQTGLTEPQWVTLRLAGQVEQLDAATLADRAHFADAAELIAGLTERGALADGRLTETGQVLVDDVQSRITATAGPIWADLPADDVAATERVLNELVARGRAVIAGR